LAAVAVTSLFARENDPITARRKCLGKLAADQPCRGDDELQLELCRQIRSSECCRPRVEDKPDFSEQLIDGLAVNRNAKRFTVIEDRFAVRR